MQHSGMCGLEVASADSKFNMLSCSLHMLVCGMIFLEALVLLSLRMNVAHLVVVAYAYAESTDSSVKSDCHRHCYITLGCLLKFAEMADRSIAVQRLRHCQNIICLTPLLHRCQHCGCSSYSCLLWCIACMIWLTCQPTIPLSKMFSGEVPGQFASDLLVT